MSEDIIIRSVAHHRNGVAGEPFYVVSFTWHERGAETRDMVAVLFAEPLHTAVLDARLVGMGAIAFGVNSWRGDRFDAQLRAAVSEFARDPESRFHVSEVSK